MADPLPLPEFACAASGGGWHLLVWVQPGAKKNEFTGVQDGRLRVRLRAPAVENKANKALMAFMAETLGLKQAQISLVSGDTGRRKRLYIITEREPDWTRLATP